MDWSQQVYAHGPLEPIADRLWMVTGRLRWSPLPRNMFVYRLDNGGLLIYSAVSLNEEGMQRLQSLGSPKIILVPGQFHRMQAEAWRLRFPEARVLCPEAAIKHVSKRVQVHGTAEKELPNMGIVYHAAQGVKAREGIYEFAVDGGVALLFCDALMNLDHQAGFGGWLMRRLGSTGFFGVTPMARRIILSDHQAFKAWLLQQGQRDDLVLIGLAHGSPITEGCAERLCEAAARI